MAHSRCPSPFCPIVSMQTLSTTRPVTVAGFPFGACAAAPVAITTTNASASAPIPTHALIVPPQVIVSLRIGNPGGRQVIPTGVAGSPDAAVDERAPGGDEERNKVRGTFHTSAILHRPATIAALWLMVMSTVPTTSAIPAERRRRGRQQRAQRRQRVTGPCCVCSRKPPPLAFVLRADTAARASTLRHADRPVSGQAGRSATRR